MTLRVHFTHINNTMMKHTFFLAAATLLMTQNVVAQNPIIRNQFSADPTARVFEGKVYLYPSHDICPLSAADYPRKDWFCMADYHVFSSENLTEWTDHGVILDQKDIPWGNPTAYSMWAPDCIEKDGKYYFFFPNAPKDGRGFGIGVAISDKPYGPFKVEPQPIEGVSGIDPCVLQASDGHNYIFWGGGGLRVARLNDNLTELSADNPTDTIRFGDRVMVMRGADCSKNLPEGFKEGPFAFERNGKYYLTYPWVRGKKGDPGPDGKPLDNHTETLAYAMSDNPMGPYEYKGIIMAESPTGCWTNHHSIVNYKNQWYLFYHHNDYSPNFDKNRSVRADSLHFNADGTIQQVIPTLRGIGVTKATDKIEIDRYSKISENVSISFLHQNDADTTKRFEGWVTTFAKPNSWAQYNTVDFGNGNAKTVTLALSNSNAGTLNIKVGNSIVATAQIKANQKTANVKVKNLPKGINNVVVELVKGENVVVDWIKFD